MIRDFLLGITAFTVALLYLAKCQALTSKDLNEIKWRTVKLWDYKTDVSGTGIILDRATGLILTNRHVCEAFNDHIVAQFYDFKTVEVFTKKRYPKKSSVDLCALNFKTLIPSNISPEVPDSKVELAEYQCVVGEPVFYSGFPYREYITVRSGIVTDDLEYREPGDTENRNVQLIDGITGAGGSGSGVYDQGGHLIGVIFAYVERMKERRDPKRKRTVFEGKPSVMVPQSELLKFLKEIGFTK